MSVSKGSPVPWKVSDAAIFAVCTFVGLSLVLFAWYGASGSDRSSTQVECVDAAVAGALVATAGNVLWILSGRRAVGLRTARQTERLERFMELEPAAEAGLAASTREKPVIDSLVAAKNLTVYHRPDCPLVDGRHVRRFNPSSSRSPAKEPCGVCLP